MSEHECIRFHLLPPNEGFASRESGTFLLDGVLWRWPTTMRCVDCERVYLCPQEGEGWYGFTDSDDDPRRLE